MVLVSSKLADELAIDGVLSEKDITIDLSVALLLANS